MRRKPKDASNGLGWQCDAYSCLAQVKGQLVSFIAKPDAIQEDCQRAAILVAPMDIRVPCPAPKIILDRGALWEKGSRRAIRISDGRLRSRPRTAGVRPWAPRGGAGKSSRRSRRRRGTGEDRPVEERPAEDAHE